MATARLLRRTGFGTTGRVVDAAVAQPDYLAGALNADPSADPGAMATPLPDFPIPAPPGKNATAAARKKLELLGVGKETIDRIVASGQPVRALGIGRFLEPATRRLTAGKNDQEFSQAAWQVVQEASKPAEKQKKLAAF